MFVGGYLPLNITLTRWSRQRRDNKQLLNLFIYEHFKVKRSVFSFLALFVSKYVLWHYVLLCTCM